MFSFIASNEPWLAKFSNLEFRTVRPTKGRLLPIKHEFFLDIDGETIHCEMKQKRQGNHAQIIALRSGGGNSLNDT